MNVSEQLKIIRNVTLRKLACIYDRKNVLKIAAMAEKEKVTNNEKLLVIDTLYSLIETSIMKGNPSMAMRYLCILNYEINALMENVSYLEKNDEVMYKGVENIKAFKEMRNM